MVSDNATEKKIRLGEIANALNVAPKLIRNWTAHEAFDLQGTVQHQANKWREYSYLDVAHLAIASQIIRYGFSIGEGHDFAGSTIVRLLSPIFKRPDSLDNMPGGVLEAICRGKHLFLFKPSGAESVAVISPLDDLPRYPGAVHIDLEYCVATAFQGLAEIGHDAFSSSNKREYSEAEAAELRANFRKFMAETDPEGLARIDAGAKAE